MLLTYKENVHSTQMYIPLKPLFSRHKGIGVQFTDEPTGNLDSENSRRVIDLLKQTTNEYGMTLLMVTHDADIAKQANHCIHLVDGRIQQN